MLRSEQKSVTVLKIYMVRLACTCDTAVRYGPYYDIPTIFSKAYKFESIRIRKSCGVELGPK